MADPTAWDIAAVAIAGTSLVASVILGVRQHRLAKAQAASEEKHRALEADVLRYQREAHSRENAERQRADVVVHLEGGGNSWRLIVANEGKAAAAKVRIKPLRAPDAEPSDDFMEPLVYGDPNLTLLEEKDVTLKPTATLSLVAALDMQSSPPFFFRVWWVDPDGTERSEVRTATW